MYQTIKINELDVHYKVSGEGQDLILLHGWGCDLEIFKGLHAQLEPYFRVYAIDFPGFGKSTEPSTVWGTTEYATLIETFIQKKGIQNPNIIAHSYGGRVTIRLANRIPLNKIIITGGAGIKPQRPLSYYIKVYSYKIAKAILQLPIIKIWGEKVLEDYRNSVGSADYQQASDVMRGILVNAVNEDLRDLLPTMSASTLLIWGENDTATPVRDGQLMEKMIPDAGLVVMKNATHYAFLEKQGEFLVIAKSFFDVK